MLSQSRPSRTSSNFLENLRWDTSLANNADKVIHGTNIKGTKHYRCKYDEEKLWTASRL